MPDPSSVPPPSTHDDSQAPVEASAARPPRAGDIDPAQLPPANFTTLVSMLSTQAMVALGILPDPSTGQAEPRLALARHFIDLLGVLDEKTRGNLSADEARLLESALHQLRMAFVQNSRK